MAVLVESYRHRTGEHCASTAMRNLLAYHGTDLSEAMVFGLASGLGFFYFANDAVSPTRMFHGRTPTFEENLAASTGVALALRAENDDARAERELCERLDAGVPVLLATDTYYLGYHHTTSHFPGHTCVAVGYDPARGAVWIADRKFPELQICSFGELRRARNAPDYPIRCANRCGDCAAGARLERPFEQAVASALRHAAREMLAPAPGMPGGIPAMRHLASDFPSWSALADWSWAARFGYQIIVKRGAAGSFFRSLYADFLREAARQLPALDALAPRMDAIAERWRALAMPLEQQSERDTCDPALFAQAGRQIREIAELEHAFYRDADAAADAIAARRA
ncbi:MAG TPA: BtrH N-terminal domain-containing protein [Myxococcota bacterium]|nr:BtrH N-terminal domain-containing protein [Myxococcota bacterium]